MSRTRTDLTDVEAAELLSKHKRTIQRWCAAGDLSGAYKAGRSWMIPAAAIRRAGMSPRVQADDVLREVRAAREALESLDPSALDSFARQRVAAELLALHREVQRVGKTVRA